MTTATQKDRPEWLTPEMFPLESRFLDLDGNRVHYVDEGSGRTLLFLHGNPAWSFVNRHLIADLRNDYRCVALDLPGYGLSVPGPNYGLTAPEHASVVEALVHELDLEDVVLFGHDWAGPIGIHVAEAMPDRFSGIILGNTWLWPIVGNKTDERFSKMMGSGLAMFLNRQFNFFPRMVLSQGLKRSRLDPLAREAYLRPFENRASRRGPIVLAGQILGATDFLRSIETHIDRIADRPSLIVWATADFAFSNVHRQRLESMFTNHTSVSLEGCGHCIQEDAPDELLESIRSWLAATFESRENSHARTEAG